MCAGLPSLSVTSMPTDMKRFAHKFRKNNGGLVKEEILVRRNDDSQKQRDEDRNKTSNGCVECVRLLVSRTTKLHVDTRGFVRVGDRVVIPLQVYRHNLLITESRLDALLRIPFKWLVRTLKLHESKLFDDHRIIIRIEWEAGKSSIILFIDWAEMHESIFPLSANNSFQGGTLVSKDRPPLVYFLIDQLPALTL